MLPDLTTQFTAIADSLDQAKTVLIATHEYPDADGLGSALAISLVCQAKGLENVVYSYGKIPGNLKFLPGIGRITTSISTKNFDIAFCLDYGDFVRLRLPDDLEIKTLITIDHHPLASQRGDIMVIAPQYSSTAEIVYWWLKTINFEMNPQVATCLLTGIVGDTGGFQHSSTSSSSLKAAADLMVKGASLSQILSRACFFQNNYSACKIVGQVLDRIRLDNRTNLAYSWLRFQEIKELEQEVFDMHDLPTIIATASPINFGLLLMEMEPNLIRASLRAEPFSNIDVGALAKLLGGGGHKYAAGFRYYGTLQEALKKFLELL